MYPILFSIGKINFYSHGLMIALGAIAGGALIFYLAKKEKLSWKFLFDTLIYSFFGGFIGARISYIVLYYYQFSNWKEMFYIWYGGLVSYGGIFFGFLTAGIIFKKRQENVLRWFDLGIIGLLLGWAIGRVGCFLTGDIPGLISSSKIAIWGQIPVSLWESLWSLLIACFLFYFLIWQKKWRGIFQDGGVFLSGLALYSLGRFVIDFYRQGVEIFWYFKVDQIVSLLIFVILVGLIYYKFQKKGEKDA